MQIETIFEALRDIPISKVPSLQKFPFNTFLPKKSKALTTNLLKDIASTNEPRLLVITGHLYFDYILERILDRLPNSMTKRQRESFYVKLEFLNRQGRFDSELYNCLMAINRLRNSFAHNIFFDLTKWDPRTIPFVRRFGLRVPKRKDLLRAFNIVLIRLSFLALLGLLIEQNRWLYLEDIPKG